MVRRASLAGVIASGFLLLLPVVALGQPDQSTDLRVLVTMEIGVGEGGPLEVTAPVGRLITYDDTDFDLKVGLRPIRVDPDTKTTEVEVVGLRGKRGRYAAGTVLDTVTLFLGDRQGVAAQGVLLELAVTRVTTTTAESNPQASSRNGGASSIRAPFQQDLEGSGCCVTCGSTQACGCSVSSSCGSCNGNC